MDYITQIDTALLLFINGMHCDLLDSVMLICTNKRTWFPLYAILLIVTIIKMRHHPRALLLFVLCTAAMITISDQACGSLIRNAVGRMRPSNPDNPISGMIHIVNGYRSGKYGFPSCHAANTFALAFALHYVWKNKWLTAGIFFWASLNCYTRIYLGVHYPGDIIAGALIGFLISTIIFRFIPWKKLRETGEQECNKTQKGR